MIVRTVLGDVDPDDLGVTFAHEHLIIDSPIVASRWPHIHLPSVGEAIAEVDLCGAAGVRAMVDAMPIGSGGDPARLAEVSRATGVHIVAATGMHTIKYYDGVEWAGESAEDLVSRFRHDILRGKEGRRAGVLKVATKGSRLTSQQRELIVAAGAVHQSTGVPILTHCEDGVGAMEQLASLTEAGVEPRRVIVSHTDKILDRGYHRAILGAGANVEYDQALRQHIVGSIATAELIASMWEEGFGNQILLGTDGARRSLWSTLDGSPGLPWLRSGFPTVLHGLGFDDSEVESMFVANPARVLAFEPPL